MTKIVIYKSTSGPVVNVVLSDDSLWLSQAQICILFERNQSVISRHISNLFKEKELNKKSNMQKTHIANSDKPVALYSLDVIISVGYRVKSKRATQFRIWASKVLKQHLIDGYTQNTDRLIERKLEIEVKESRDIMSKMIQSEEFQAQADRDAINLVSTYLGTATDKEAIILKAHLLIERFLTSFNEKHCKNHKAFNDSRQSYKQLLGLARSQFNNNEHNALWDLLTKLNTLRNTFSHTLDVAKSDFVIQEFLDLCIRKINSKEMNETVNRNASLKQTLVHLCGITFKTIHANV